MPELPEVETVRRGLLPVLKGRVLAHVRANRPDLRFPLPKGMARRMTGRRVTAIDRRAKFLLMRLEGGLVFILHLGMSGRVLVYPPGVSPPPEGKHDHIVIETDHGAVMRFNDPRRFGSADLTGDNALHRHKMLAALGPEPLGDDLTPEILANALKGKRTPIKSALLDQRVIAGVGNIYACEALFRAGISPRRSAAAVQGGRAQKLCAAVKAVLAEAVQAGGSTLRDHRAPSGELGYFQHAFRVYGREGEPCPACAQSPVRRITQSGRSTFFCPRCQR
ncbi:MAG: bifunctional DNA-formamidopyrimidine glycosylase/DNA-(apurinic or apyrimidinic site) lyase [Rhodospirillales bacterium]